VLNKRAVFFDREGVVTAATARSSDALKVLNQFAFILPSSR